MSLPLEPRAGYLVAQMDGQTTVQELVDMAPWPRIETIALLLALLDEDVIFFA